MGKKRGGGIRVKQQGPTKAQKDMMKQFANGGNPMDEFMVPPEDMIMPPPPPDRNFQMFWPIRKYKNELGYPSETKETATMQEEKVGKVGTRQ